MNLSHRLSINAPTARQGRSIRGAMRKGEGTPGEWCGPAFPEGEALESSAPHSHTCYLTNSHVCTP